MPSPPLIVMKSLGSYWVGTDLGFSTFGVFLSLVGVGPGRFTGMTLVSVSSVGLFNTGISTPGISTPGGSTS